MSAKTSINVVLYWHMHQPEYRDRRNDHYYLPWTYLHAIKDYSDMAAHIEENPQARTVINFTPTLLEQIDNYAKQLQAYLDKATTITDPTLAALVARSLPTDKQSRMKLAKDCLRANKERFIERYRHYGLLADQVNWLETHDYASQYMNDQFYFDLLVWFHLAWLGESIKRCDVRVSKLMQQACNYTLEDRHILLTIMTEVISDLIPRYKKLVAQGVVELSVTPYAHPIMPLMLDFNSAAEAMPEVVLPAATSYPEGEERVRWHIEKGLQVFEKYFGFRPRGCWPSEGSVSEATVQLLNEAGITWLASGETVLHNSLGDLADTNLEHRHCIHQAYQLNTLPLRCFFRDDGLSDAIGFTYSAWHGDDAVANLIHNIGNIADACATANVGESAIVSIILDGENAWEYYPENGYHFLTALYEGLVKDKRINLTTYSEYLEKNQHSFNLSRLVAGSWVYGSFSTWIGDKDKNRAWDMLVEAKLAVDTALASNKLRADQVEAVLQQLAICEGSDWFWWFGDYNPSESVADFDLLYRTHLLHLYQLLEQTPPASLSLSLSHGSGAPAAGGVMRRGKE